MAARARGPEWPISDTGSYRVPREVFEDMSGRQGWTVAKTLGCVVSGLAIIGAISAAAVAVERTKEVPALREDVAKLKTSDAVNVEAHRAILERLTEQGDSLKGIDRKLDRALRTTREP